MSRFLRFDFSSTRPEHIEWPKRYTGSDFLRKVDSFGSLPYVRSLYFPHFLDVDGGYEEEARQDWLYTADYARRLGGLNLEFLHISGYWDEEDLCWNTLVNALDDEAMEIIRTFVNQHVWPLEHGKPPASVSQYLAVEVKSDALNAQLANATYKIRRADYHPPEEQAGKRDLVNGVDAFGQKIKCGTRNAPIKGEALGDYWVEEFWIIKYEEGSYN